MNIIVVDTETTGLGQQKGREDAVVQVGAVVISGGMIEDRFSEYCWPGERYFEDGRAAKALAVNELDIELLRKASPSRSVAAAFRNWLKFHLPGTMTAYNVAFDRPFLELPPWSLHEIEGLRWGKCIMIEASRRLGEMGLNHRNRRFGDWKWVRLSDAAKLSGVELYSAHDALSDAEAAAEIVIEMKLDI